VSRALLASAITQEAARLRLVVDDVEAGEMTVRRAASDSLDMLEALSWLLADPDNDEAHDDAWAAVRSRTRRVLAAASKPAVEGEPLSDREWQVAGLIASGHSNKEIAKQLCVTQQTVKFHIGNIFRKLGLRSRTQVALAYRDHVDNVIELRR
jgi:ATP/maltotriose-dependent transcriptional regulator MalT